MFLPLILEIPVPECPDKDGIKWINIQEGIVVPNPEWLDLIGKGRAILRFQSQQNRRIAEAGAFEWDMLRNWPDIRVDPLGLCYPEEIRNLTWRCICLNTPLFSSQSFEGVWDPEKHDVMVAFAKMATGKWKVSLYSTKPEVDCGAIAKTFGGGGHRGASGFECDKLPWEAV